MARKDLGAGVSLRWSQSRRAVAAGLHPIPAMSSSSSLPSVRVLGTRGIFVSAVALVVSASTLVSDFTGYVRLGAGFAGAVAVGLMVMIPVALSTCDLAVGSPRAGGIYRYVRTAVQGRRGRTWAFFAALLFTGTFLFGAAGETVAGAHALRALAGAELPLGLAIAAVGLAGIVPNLFGLRWATGVTTGLLAVMLGVRWFFGLAGFFDWGGAGSWQWEHLQTAGGVEDWRWNEILRKGLALGFWCFVGVEGACALAGETQRPERSLPRGLLLALAAIMATNLVTGLGSLGGRPLAEWAALIADDGAAGGEAPHLAVGAVLFGDVGRALMALATLASTLSTLLVAFAAMPRMLQALGRDRLPPAWLARVLALRSARTGAPWGATVLLGGTFLAVALAWGAVVECLYAAAYLWFVRHAATHALAGWRRWRWRSAPGVLGRSGALANATAGFALTAAAFVVSFAGSHLHHGLRALAVAAVAGALVALSRWSRRNAARRRTVRSDRAQASVSARRVWV